MVKEPLRRMTTPCSFIEGLLPEQTGPFLPVKHQEVNIFNEILSNEVDSRFSSSLCCCDCCFDDFVGHWPEVSFREAEFQEQSMEPRWLVDYSRLPGLYTLAEISTLRELVQCPRCSVYGPHNVWVYEHKFSGSEEIEVEIDELLTLGMRTPFLMLEHPFSKRVLAEVKSQAQEQTAAALGVPLFRARQKGDVLRLGQKEDTLETYGAPPAERTGEGRFNHAGIPMLYLASSAETAAAELGIPGAECVIGELSIKAPLKVFDLFELDEDAPAYELLLALRSSALLLAPRTGEGWLKREYVFSRFVADCARSAGFDAIRYGSTKQANGHNYVLLELPDDIGSLLTLDGYRTMVCSQTGRRP